MRIQIFYITVATGAPAMILGALLPSFMKYDAEA
jgi:hypothetical protein